MKLRYIILFTYINILIGFTHFIYAQADACGSANVLNLSGGGACATYNTAGFGNDGPAFAALTCTGTQNRDAWSIFTATTTTTTVTFTNTSTRNAVVVVYNTGTCTPATASQLTCFATNAGATQTTTVTTTVGNSYLVRVVRLSGGGTGSGEVTGTLCVIPNDRCSTALPLTVNAASCSSGTTSGATDVTAPTGGNVCNGGTATDRTVWYTFTTGASATNHTITLTNNTAGYNAVVELYTGACGGGLTYSTCANTGGNGSSETLTFAATASTTYRVRVSGNGNGVAGDFCIQVSTPPANDICSSATALTVDGACVNGNTTSATNNTAPTGGNVCNGATTTDRTVWYSFTALASSQTINLTAVSGSYDAVVDVYTGTCGGGLTYLNCADANGNGGSETLALTGLTVGTTYTVRVSGFGNGVAGTFCIQVVTPTPTNDTCAAATSLTVGAACTNGTTINATNNTAPTGAACGAIATDRTVWYTFTAIGTNQTISLTNSTATYDPVISVYSGACGSLAAVNCINGTGAGANESLALTGLTIGTTYTIRISGNGNGNAGSFCINVTQPAPTNDTCAAATALTVGAACTSGTTIGATNNAAPAGGNTCDGTATDRTVWYSFTATATSQTISLTNSSALYDAVINVYSGGCAGITNVACQNAGGNGVNESLTLNTLTVGVNYLIRVSGYGTGNAGNFCIQVTAAPNDNCSNAIVLSSNSTCITTTGNTSGTTQSQAATTCNSRTGTADDDIWYSFTAQTATHTITVAPTTMTDVVVELFSGTCGTLASLSCADATTGASNEVLTYSGLIIGTTYYVRVYSFGNGTGQGAFNICVTHTPPTNDECANAITLTPTAFCTQGSVIGATNNATNDIAGCPRTENTVWYKFTATQTRHVVSVQNYTATFDLTYALYSGTCGTLTQISCINANGNGGNEINTFTGLTVGTTYFVRVSNAITNSLGDFCIQVYNVNPPNDDCGSPTLLTMNGICTNGDNTNATTGTDNSGACGTASSTIWFSFVATQTSHYLYAYPTNSGSLDVTMQVYTGACNSLTSVSGCIDATGGGSTESSTITGLTIGVTYLVRISSFSATVGTICVGVQAAPANDNCTGATNLTVNNPCVSGSNILATATTPTISCGSNTRSVWYSFTTGAAGNYQVNTTNITGFDAIFALYTGACATTPTQVAGSCTNAGGVGTNESNTFALTANTTYFVQVSDFDGTRSGNFCIQVLGPPANDNCANATTLTVNGSCTAGTNVLASSEVVPLEPGGACVNNSQTVWYRFTATNTSQTINLTNLTDDLGFTLYSGTCLVPASVSCIDANTGTTSESNTFTGLTIGQTYLIRVAGNAAGDEGTFCISVISPPVNDLCTSATALTMNYPCVLGSNAGTTTTGTDPAPVACGVNNNNMWYSFVATQTSHRVSAFPKATGAGTDFTMNLYSSSNNTCSGTLNSLGCRNVNGTGSGEEGVFSGLTIGNTYFVLIRGNSASDNAASFCISVTQDSDICTSAVPLGINSECIAGGNVSATTTAGETTTCGASAVTNATWYTFVPTSSTTRISVDFNPNVDGRVTVFNASGYCTGMTQIGCMDAAGNGGTETLILNQLSVGSRYFVMVDRTSASTNGAFCIKVTSSIPCGANPQPADDCNNAPLINNLNGYCGVTSTSLYTAGGYNNLGTNTTPFCSAGASIENNSFLKFTASATTATFTLNIVSDAPYGGRPCSSGLQMQVLSVSGSDCKTGTWTAVPGTCINPSGGIGATNTVSITGLVPGQVYYIMFDGFAGQECGYSLSTLEGAGVFLPVEFLNFSVKTSTNTNMLKWATSQQLNADYFQIDRSYNGLQFESIGKIRAAGNNSSIMNYSFTDLNPLKGRNYYRITVIDTDGKISFSNTILVNGFNSEDFNILNLYPNPTSGAITASIFAKDATMSVIDVIAPDGRTVLHKEANLLANNNEVVLDVQNFTSGLYIVKITSYQTGEVIYQKFVKE